MATDSPRMLFGLVIQLSCGFFVLLFPREAGRRPQVFGGFEVPTKRMLKLKQQTYVTYVGFYLSMDPYGLVPFSDPEMRLIDMNCQIYCV